MYTLWLRVVRTNNPLMLLNRARSEVGTDLCFVYFPTLILTLTGLTLKVVKSERRGVFEKR